MRLGMMIELDLCIGCRACVSACKERWDTGAGARRDWVHEYEHGARGKDLGITFFPGLCNHCDDHPCTTDCPTGATYARDDGVVVVDPNVCIGCGNCVPLCPYGARSPDPDKGIVEKCNLCAPYLARGEQPACVETCLAECRHVGDLDDPRSEISRRVAAREAKPLVTPEVQIGPRVYYAPEAARQQVLSHYAISPPRSTTVTHLWRDVTRPAARYGVPALAAATATFGLVANVIARRQQRQAAAIDVDRATGEDAAADGPSRARLPRHKLGIRLLHWFNALSWILLLVTGTALIVAPTFAIFGEGAARWVSDLFGGQATLLALHAGWGLLWAVVIVPAFLVIKRGGLEALAEIRLRRDDLRWLARKPLRMLGLSQAPLPPQDKYNAGQKVFAISALLGTALIVATGLVMTFHLGPPAVVRAAILLHKVAVGLALAGVAVHVTMAAIIREERPALRSMVDGQIDRDHAASHNQRWVERTKQGS